MEIHQDHRRVHQFVSFYIAANGRSQRVFIQRDMGAVFQLMGAFVDTGYRIGDQIFNFPGDEAPRYDPPRPQDLHYIDVSHLSAGSRLLETTRPPMDDVELDPRRGMKRAYTNLEEYIIQVLRAYFTICTRSQVKLANSLIDALPREHANKWNVQYYANNATDGRSIEGTYRALAAYGEPMRAVRRSWRTAAYLVNLEELWPGGPAFTVAFGMTSRSTLFWHSLLRRSLSYLLELPGLSMAEIRGAPFTDRPKGVDAFSDWSATVIVEGARAEPLDLDRQREVLRVGPVPVR